MNFQIVDKKSYAYYENSQWDSLIVLGRKAVKNNIDYYYLNYRLGVAYYYTNNFFQAQYYLQKALKQNSEAWNDDFFKELLHRSFVYTNRVDLATDVGLPVNSKMKDPLNKSKITFVVGGGKSFGVDGLTKENHNIVYSSLYRQNSVKYIGLDAYHQFNSAFGLDVLYSSLGFNMEAAFFDNDSSISDEYTIVQNNISIQPRFTLGTNWQLSPVLGFSFSKGEPFDMLDTITHEYGNYNYNEKDFLIGFNVYRYLRNMKLGFNFGGSNFSNTQQFQVGGNISYFPFGNLNLYSYSALTMKIENSNENVVFQQKIGFRVVSKIWLELEGVFGDLKNYSDFSLGYGYNIPDEMDMILSGKIIFVKSENVNFYLETKYANKYLYHNTIDVKNNEVKTKINYNQWNISGGLLWKF